MAEEFLFLGSVKDNVPRSVQKGRVDKRMIQTSRKNFSIKSGEQYVLLDAKERGDLYGIRIVSDNPYLEVFLSLDEWRTENASAAEILLQPQTGRLLSNFEAVDGGHPGIGYSLLYNPDIPEEYNGRIRIILKNRIRPQFAGRLSGSAAQQDIFSAGGYTAKGGAPQPLYGGHGAGFMVNIPHLDGVPFEVYENEVGFAIAQNPSVPFWNVQGAAFTSPPSAYLGTKKGALHPYIGMAGRPILEADLEHQNNNPTHVFFDDPEAGQNNSRPPRGSSWASQQIQDIYLVDFSGTEIASVFLDGNNLGQPIFFKDGPNFYFPGHLEDATTGLALPTKFATNGGVAYSGNNVVRLKVIPGLKLAPPPFKSDRPVMESNQGAWGMCRTAFDRREHAFTSTQQTKPEIYVKSAEVKRLKRVSYDG